MIYEIFEATDPCTLVNHVKAGLKEGWLPIGGVAVVYVTAEHLADLCWRKSQWLEGGCLYSQAMTNLNDDAPCEIECLELWKAARA